MADWSTSQIAFEADTRSALVKPPLPLLIATGVVSCIAIALLFIDSSFGYGLTVVASLLGGYTALVDQKRSGSANYISYDSFRNILRVIRFAIVARALAHIAVLAVNASKGGGLF